MTENQKAKCAAIYAHYGAQSQLRQLCEECGELIQAACKLQRKIDSERPAAQELVNLMEEIADVSIMVEQVSKLFGSKPLSVMIDRKLDRQLQRMRGEDDA